MVERTGVGLRFDHVTKEYGADAGVRAVSLEVAPGECVAVMGASGCGKTTLVRIAAGLERVDGGRVEFIGESGPLARERVEVGVCFQEPRLLPWRTALGNVSLPLELRGERRRDARLRAAEALDLVGLSGWERALPASLSGGMRMRVGLARAIVARPRVLLLDEPCSGLDVVTRVGIEDSIARLRESMHITVVLVTHAIEEAAFLANRVVIIAGKPATIVEEIPVGRGSGGSEIRDSDSFGASLGTLMRALRRAARSGVR